MHLNGGAGLHCNGDKFRKQLPSTKCDQRIRNSISVSYSTSGVSDCDVGPAIAKTTVPGTW